MLTTSINFDDLSAKAARKSWPAFCVVAVLLVCVVASLDVKVPGYIPVQGFYFAPIYLAIWYCEGFVAFLVVCIAAIAHFYVVSRGIADQVLPWQYIVAYLSTSIVFLGFVALVYFFKLLFYRLQTESRTDALIGLKSRRGFLESAEFEIARAARYRQPLVLARIFHATARIEVGGIT